MGRPLVGRADELALLSSALDAAISGRGSVHFLVGEPGIGKSRLCEELAEPARQKGALSLWGHAWEAGGAPPFWPWTELLRGLLEQKSSSERRSMLGSGASDIAQLLPELADELDVPVPGPLSPGTERFRLFDAVAGVFSRASAATPLLLVLEDLHAADASTLLLLAFFAQRIGRGRLLLIGTYRELEAKLAAETAELLARASRHARTAKLDRLARQEVGELIAASPALVATPDLVTKIFDATEGNPLFVDEVLRVVEIETAAGGNATAIPMPQGIQGVIMEHLAKLDEEARETLVIASAVGREQSLPLLAAVSKRPAENIAMHLARAGELNLTSQLGAGRYRFAHVLLRDVLHDRIPEARRWELHLAIADALEAMYAAHPDPPREEIAHHLMQAGPSAAARALDNLLAAGRRANAMLAYEQAAESLAKALDFLDVIAPGDVERRFDLMLEILGARIRASRREEAKQIALEAAELARRLKSPELVARVALEYGSAFVVSMIDPVLIQLLEEALASLPNTPSSARAQLSARLAAAVTPSEDPSIPVTMALDAIEMVRPFNDKRALLSVLYSAAAALAAFSAPRVQMRISEETLSLAEELGEKAIALRSLSRLILGSFEVADLASVEAYLEAYARLASEFRQPHVLWRVPMFRALRARLEGRFAAADSHLKEAQAVLEGVDLPESKIAFLFHQVAAARMKDDRQTIAAARARLGEQRLFGLPHQWQRQLHALEAFAGDLESARRAVPPDVAPFVKWESNSALAMSEVCVIARDRERCAALMEVTAERTRDRLFGWGTSGFSYEGPAEIIALKMACVLERWDEAELHYRASVELATRIGARPALAHIERCYAEELILRGRLEDRARAEALATSAARRGDELGMSDFAARARALLETAPSTDSASSALAQPRLFGNGRYVVQRTLGKGGQKTVYLVHDTALDRECALAWIESEQLDQVGVGRLRKEALALARMGAEPHVVTVFDIGDEDGRPYVVTEHVSGGDLAALLSGGEPLGVERAIALTKDVLRGLIAAHARGIIHRDLKPSNVWLDRSGRAKIGDFGIALLSDHSRITATGMVSATAEYAAPEVLLNREIDGRADLYSLGCTLYEALTGHTPFVGNVAALVTQHLQATPVPPSRHNPDVTEELDRFVLSLLAKDPANRPRGAQEALDELDAIALLGSNTA